VGEADRTVRVRSLRGETLIESLASILVLSLVAAAAYTGVMLAIGSSSAHSRSGTSETLLRSAAEVLQNPDLPYRTCATPSAYAAALSPLSAGEPGFGVSVRRITHWRAPTAANPDSLPSTVRTSESEFQTSCSNATDAGLQRIVVDVQRPDGRRDTMTVLKRRT
jgi:type II secretory pathway pseudopilin PulG